MGSKLSAPQRGLGERWRWNRRSHRRHTTRDRAACEALLLQWAARAGTNERTRRAREGFVAILLLSEGVWLDKGTLVVEGDLSARDVVGKEDLDELPAKLRVTGDLSLRGCKSLKRLPEELCVCGTLQVWACPELTSLPQILNVGENLEIDACTGIKALPEKLTVGEGLQLDWCTGLTALPKGLKVQNSLHIGYATALSALPDGLSIAHSLSLEGCSRIRKLPKNLHVGKNLYLGGCSSLTALPRGLHVLGDLKLWRCTSLSELPQNLSVSGDLEIQWGTHFTSFPSDAHIGGSVTLQNCNGLTTFPEALHVNGDLDLSNCKALRVLPAVLNVTGSFTLTNSMYLNALPANFRAMGDVNLKECSLLCSLPEGLVVRGNLTLNNCVSMRALPHGLKVMGNLSCKGCTRLKDLPGGLRVRGNLDLFGCEAITELPSDMNVGKNLNIECCVSLESLPLCILDWPSPQTRRQGGKHNIYLGGSGLSEETLTWLRSANAPHIRFFVHLGGSTTGTPGARAKKTSKKPFTDVADAILFWERESGFERSEPASIELKMPSERRIVLTFLNKLRGSKEFGLSETRRALAKRIVLAVDLLQDPECREEVLQRMGDSIDACHDKPVWALNQLAVIAFIVNARGDREALRELGRRVMNLMIVHKHAAAKVASLGWVDDVCVYLLFEIKLRQALDLPVEASAMIFPSYVTVSKKEFRLAKKEANAVDDAAFETWLESWPEWQRQDRLEFAEQLNWETLEEVRLNPSEVPETDLSGNTMQDPIMLRSMVWSLSDVLKHWVRTGVDLTNAPLKEEDFLKNAQRIVSPRKPHGARHSRRKLKARQSFD
mmetsp:Transcript_21750/g.38430  ORF Transcript_21750/g.38430 Transcript_21750/m.38430 type:complete len:833 (+) Transcript_21750:165-2663(+)